jgi:hypothetical protein
VINMRNDRKIADVGCIHEDTEILAGWDGQGGRGVTNVLREV